MTVITPVRPFTVTALLILLVSFLLRRVPPMLRLSAIPRILVNPTLRPAPRWKTTLGWNVPRLDEETAAALSSRLRAVIAELRREGRTLEWLRSFALVDEETYVWMLKAADVDEIALVNHRAQVPYDHVVEAVPGESSR